MASHQEQLTEPCRDASKTVQIKHVHGSGRFWSIHFCPKLEVSGQWFANFGQSNLGQSFFFVCCGWFWCGKVFYVVCFCLFVVCVLCVECFYVVVCCVVVWWVCSGKISLFSSEGWGPEGWGAQNFTFFFPSPAANFVLFFPLWVFSRGILVVFEVPGAHLEFSDCRVKPRWPGLHPTLRGPTLRGPTTSGPHFFWVWVAPHPVGPHHDTKNIKKWIGQNWIGQNWIGQNWSIGTP